jgi:hypothetical protein
MGRGMRASAMIVVSLVAGCAPYTYDANGNPVRVRSSAAYYGTLSTSDNCGRPDHPKTCAAKWQAAPRSGRISSPQSYEPIQGAPVY